MSQSTGTKKEESSSASTIRSEPAICKSGCGFFGNPDFAGHCSSCFKKLNKTADNTAKVARIVAPTPSPASVDDMKMEISVSHAPSDIAGAGDGEEMLPAVLTQKDKKRCFTCRKKVGFTGCECRCGFIFCGEHRYVEAHACKVDYKALSKAHLEKENPVIQAKKIDLI
jgi:hypothetical protein